MNDIGIFKLLFDPQFVITSVAAVFAFATIVTLGMELLERNKLGERMKAVSERREELRQRHLAALNKRSTLRSEPINFMKHTVERLRLSKSWNPRTRAKSSPAPASAARRRSWRSCFSAS